jgi:Brp/Blh family beta-carotene 15,15'-monooxygenase
MTSWDMLAIAAILLLGVPHGGLDGAIARRAGWPSGLIPWLCFHLSYIGLAILVTALWWLFPLISLGVFLIISALHFGASDIADTGSDWLPWMAHGGLICIAIPNLQPNLVEPIFTVLVNADNTRLLMQAITNLFYPWVATVTLYCGYAYFQPQYRKPLGGLLLLIALVYLLPPLISFAVYFCLWHSPGHMLRLWRSLEQAERRRSLEEAGFYTGAAWFAMGLAFYFLPGSASSPLLQLTFIGLAALTLPHMLLVDFADRKNNKSEELP